MSGAVKTRPIEIRIGGKISKLFIVPQQKARGIEYLLAEYAVDRVRSVPTKEVFGDLDRKYSKQGNVLAGFRLRDELTQVELAKKIGTSQPVIAAIENGKRKMGKTLAFKLAKIFKTDYRVFLN